MSQLSKLDYITFTGKLLLSGQKNNHTIMVLHNKYGLTYNQLLNNYTNLKGLLDGLTQLKSEIKANHLPDKQVVDTILSYYKNHLTEKSTSYHKQVTLPKTIELLLPQYEAVKSQTTPDKLLDFRQFVDRLVMESAGVVLRVEDDLKSYKHAIDNSEPINGQPIMNDTDLVTPLKLESTDCTRKKLQFNLQGLSLVTAPVIADFYSAVVSGNLNYKSLYYTEKAVAGTVQIHTMIESDTGEITEVPVLLEVSLPKLGPCDSVDTLRDKIADNLEVKQFWAEPRFNNNQALHDKLNEAVRDDYRNIIMRDLRIIK